MSYLTGKHREQSNKQKSLIAGGITSKENDMGDHDKTGHSTGNHKTAGNDKPVTATSGLDTSGQFRIGDEFTLSLSGNDIVISQVGAHRTKTLSASVVAGALQEAFFEEY